MAIILPTPGGDIGTWGHKVNDALTTLDTTDKALAASVVAEAQARGTEIFNHATAEAQARGEAISAAVRAEALGRTVQLETHSVEEVAARGAAISNGIAASRPILYGTGFPNGLVAAPVGTLYADTAVTNGASLWQKVVGTSTSGWVVVRGDSGSRNIADLLEPNRVDFGVTKNFSVRRVSGWVALSFAATPLVGQGVAVFGALPNGFRPNVGAQVVTWQENADRIALASISTANCTLYFHKPGGSGGGKMMLYVAFPTSDDWPTMLPGTN